MAEYNPFKKAFWTWDNLSNKEQRIYDKKVSKEKREMKAKVKAYEKQKNWEQAERISNKIESKFGLEKPHNVNTGDPTSKQPPDWKTCPKCHGTNVKLIKRTTMMFYFWAGGILMLLVGIIIWPLLIPGVLAIFASPLFLFMPRQKKCRDCTHTYF